MSRLPSRLFLLLLVCAAPALARAQAMTVGGLDLSVGTLTLPGALRPHFGAGPTGQLGWRLGNGTGPAWILGLQARVLGTNTVGQNMYRGSTSLQLALRGGLEAPLGPRVDGRLMLTVGGGANTALALNAAWALRAPIPGAQAEVLVRLSPGMRAKLGLEWAVEPLFTSSGLPLWALTTLGVEWGG